MRPETTIYLLRHGHADWSEDDGRPLSSDGMKAAHVVADRLAERPIVALYTSQSPLEEFEAIREAWSSPDEALRAGESNVRAQIRGLAVVRTVADRHAGSHVVLATHGNLLTLILNALDRTFAYEFWRRLSFPDIYQLTFVGAELGRVERLWDAA